MIKNKNLKRWKNEVYSCCNCGFCREQIDYKSGTYGICPVWEVYGFDSYTARGRNNIAQALLEGRLEYTPRLIEHVYKCLLCGNCKEHCFSGGLYVDVPEIVKAMRRDIVDGGFELDSLKKVDSKIRKTHNVFEKSSSEGTKWDVDLNLPKKGSILYWSGCYNKFKFPKTSRSVVAILREANINPAYLGEEEWCCGGPQDTNGQKILSEELIKHNVETIKASGTKIIITSCAGCYHSLKSDWPKVIGELPFKVVHISEFVADLLTKGEIRFKKPIDRKITYHDPCHLGRYEGVYNPPRDILKAIPKLQFVEMLRNRENAWCCGGGGGATAVAFQELSSEIAKIRIDEANSTKANAIVTACPFCKNVLTNATKNDMEVYDLPVLIAEAMELEV